MDVSSPFLRCLVAVLLVLKPAWTFCPAGCLCDDETLEVTCDNVNLEVVPITFNPSVQRLVLRHNRIKTIDTSIRFYPELVFFDLSHNKLVTINNKSFEFQKKLTELHLDNNKIAFVSNRSWTGLRSLSVLSLRNNFLETLDERTFATAPKLREIDLGQNRLDYLHPATFAGLADLRNLYLDDNQLSRVPALLPALTPLEALAELNLAGNELPVLLANMFTPLKGLVHLDLSSASIRNVSDDAFRGLTHLRVLKLHDNKLLHVPTEPLSVLQHLEELTLGRNGFVEFTASVLRGLYRLRTLEIQGAQSLVSVYPGALTANRDLQVVRITGCKRLSSLPEGLFTGLPSIRELDLRDNGLTSIPENLAPWSQIVTLDVSENPLLCGCQLAWLRDLLNRQARNRSLGGGGMGGSIALREKVVPQGLRAASASIATQTSQSEAGAVGGRGVEGELGNSAEMTEHEDTAMQSSSLALAAMQTAPEPLTHANNNPKTWNGASFGALVAGPTSVLCAGPPPLTGQNLKSLSDEALNCRSPGVHQGMVIGFACAVAVIVVGLLLLTWHHRRRIRLLCSSRSSQKHHPAKWTPAPTNLGRGLSVGSTLSSRPLTPDYHKTCNCCSEGECAVRGVTMHNSLKPYPRTEL